MHVVLIYCMHEQESYYILCCTVLPRLHPVGEGEGGRRGVGVSTPEDFAMQFNIWCYVYTVLR